MQFNVFIYFISLWLPCRELTRFWCRIIISCQQSVQGQRRDGADFCVVRSRALCLAEQPLVPGCAASKANGSRAHAFLRIGRAVLERHNFSSDAFHQMRQDGFGTVDLGEGGGKSSDMLVYAGMDGQIGRQICHSSQITTVVTNIAHDYNNKKN